MSKEKKLPYSYHTFLFPFKFRKDKDIIPSGRWKREKLTSMNINSTGDQYKLDFAMFQYFTLEARELLFNSKTSFYYDLDGLDKKYVICKDEKTYELLVKKVSLFTFSSDVGIFMLETINEKHPDIAEIKAINEHGRRIALPFIGCHEKGKSFHILSADSITLFGVTENFKEDSKAYVENRHVPYGDIMKPILNLIDELIPSVKKTPVIDDRMFVCCLIRNNHLSDSLKSFDEQHNDIRNKIYCDTTLSDLIYSIGFIDSGSASCQSLDMRERLLRKCVYDRWRDWGTIDVITHHSFIRITGESEKIQASVINPFITEYVYMAVGVLIQRATILSLSDESAIISEEYFTGEINAALDEKLRNLKRKYVNAQNNIFLFQLTVQEQGIDEFSMLKRELYIDESLEKLDKRINSIYDFTSEYAEQEENRLLNTVTVYGLPLAVFQSLVAVFALFISENGWKWSSCVINICLVGSIVISGVILLALILRSKKHRSKKEKVENK